MEKEYAKIVDQARSKNKENKLFFDRLKKKKPSDLDIVSHEAHDDVFNEIDCLKCANCCKTTGPLLLQKDIERMANHLKIRPAAFAEKYLRVDEDNDNVFKQMPCPFIGHDNYCSVYEARPNACREFPHTQQRNVLQKLKITYQNTMICPAVALIVEQLKQHYKDKL